MSVYARNKARSITPKQKRPTLTDQSAARETDRTIIVQRFLTHGQIPGGPQPMYGDFTQLPDDLAGFLAQARSIHRLQGQLPPEMKNLSLNELLSLTTKQLAEKLKKPEEKPANPPAATGEAK